MTLTKKSILLILLVSYTLLYFLPAQSNAEKYDRILTRLERGSENIIPEPKKYTLTFEHKELPVLDGTWIIKKKSVKRIETLLTKPISQVHCNSRLPFEERPFEKEVVLSPQGQDFFVLKALYPASNDTFLDSNKTRTINYQNVGLKGVIIPHEITYTYTLKLINHTENPALARQLWFNGKLFIKNISQDKISGVGYETEYTPECIGSVRDEIEFELVKVDKRELANKD